MKYYYCFDVGGTFIKSAIVSEEYKILYQEKFDTNNFYKTKNLAKTILEIIQKLNKDSKFKFDDCLGIGCGIPGLVDDGLGIIKYVNALDIKDENFREIINQQINIPVKLANDAECATIAEHKLGAGKDCSNMLMLTIGTGIGSGIILNNTSIRKYSPYSCEIGHMILKDKKSYQDLASTKALVDQTKLAMLNNKNSKMWNTYNEQTVSGKTVFEYKDIDETANQVFENYISLLGIGLINVLNAFNPEVVIIGGAISNQKDNLIVPLANFVNHNMFTKNIGEKIIIKPANLANDAGVLGARCLFD